MALDGECSRKDYLLDYVTFISRRVRFADRLVLVFGYKE